MGEKILEPKITVSKIEIEADKESKEDVERFLNAWTMNIPVIQIGEGKDGETSYVLNTGDLRSLEIEIKINSIPSFSMTINDGDYKIREALKKKIDKGIIAFGYKDWLVKFNIIILNTSSEAGDAMLDLSGIIYFKDLYTIEQKIYKEKTPKDILTEILKECNLGLYVVDNDWLNIPITENFINPHDMRISAIENLIYTKTRNNIWCFDLFGYMHIGNISSMQKEEISKYTLKPHTGKQIEESPMILTSIKHDPDGKEKFEDDNKIPIDYYTINNNISELLIHNVKSYSVVLENDKEELMEDDCGEDVGLDYDERQNYFSGFQSTDFNFYRQLVNKELKGNMIKVYMKNLIFELLPFDVVNFECFLAETQDKPFRLSKEHSGNKLVIGYTIQYTSGESKEDSNVDNKMSQIIHLI